MISDATLGRVLPRGAVLLLGDLVRATCWMLVGVGLISYAAIYVRLGLLLLARPGSNDFTIFYYTARMVSDGLPMYGDLPAAYRVAWKGGFLGNLNPPHFQLLMAPLARLSYTGALLAWFALNAAVVACAWWMTTRELRPTLTPARVLVTALAVFASASWTSVAVTGEMSLLLLVPFVAAWIAARHGRWLACGVWLGVCLAFKPFFLVYPAWLAVRRRWRALIGMLIGAGACVAAGSIAYGLSSYLAWVRGLDRVGWWWLSMNVSLRGLAERLFGTGVQFTPLVLAPAVTRPLWLAAALSVASATALLVGRRCGDDADRGFAVLLVAALLVSPLGWVYYLPLATAPLLALVMRGEFLAAGRPALGLFVGGLAFLYLPMEVTERGQPSAAATLLLASGHAWGALLLWASLLIVGSRAARAEAA